MMFMQIVVGQILKQIKAIISHSVIEMRTKHTMDMISVCVFFSSIKQSHFSNIAFQFQEING